MRSIIIFLALCLFAPVFFAADCDPEFQDPVHVRALDALGRPIQGAQVVLTYQIDRTSGKGYATTNPFTTPENGTVRIFVTNREILEDRVDCEIDVNVTFDNVTVTKIITAQRHPFFVDVRFDAYGIAVQVLDDQNRPIEGATVLINEQAKITNAQGYAPFKAIAGPIRVFASYNEGKAERNVELTKDSSFSLQIGQYDLVLTAKDDSGVPLDAIAIIAGKEYPFTGELSVSGVPTPDPTITVRHESIEKSVAVDLQINKNYEVIFDITPPSILQVVEIDATDKRRFGIVANDPGPFASGIDPGSLVFRYSGDGRDWKKSLTYLSRTNQLVAEVDPLLESFFFEVELKDKDGNKQVAEGKLSVEVDEPPANNTNNSTGPPPDGQSAPELPLIPIAVGVVVFVALIAAVLRLRKQGQEESG